jgi:Bacterial EndoU nuclease
MKDLFKKSILVIVVAILITSILLIKNQEGKNNKIDESGVEILFPKYLSEYNFKHILEGNINRRGEATGFHHNPSAPNKDTKIIKIISKENSCGVYKAQVQVAGKLKDAYSTMFPDKLTKSEILDDLKYVYEEGLKKFPKKDTFTIKTKGCFSVFMVLDNNSNIITSYPIY